MDVHREMACRNNSMIADVLEAMTHVMGQENQALEAQHNQQGVVDEFFGLGKFQRNN